MFNDADSRLHPTHKQLFQDSIAQLGFPAVPHFWDDDKVDPAHRLLPLELVLAHTPNLEYLRMPLACHWTLRLLPHLANTRPHLLTRLRFLEILHYNVIGDPFDISMDAVQAVTDVAPNLDALCLPEGRPRYIRGFRALPGLRQLVWQALVAGCAADMDMLVDMLDAAPRLETLVLPWDGRQEEPLGAAANYYYSDDDDERPDRRTSDVWAAIARRRDSLRELSLDVRADTPHGEGQRQSLRDFERLEVLRVNGHALGPLRVAWRAEHERAGGDGFLSTLLPPSIREVVFWGLDAGEMQTAVLAFAKTVAVGGCCPNLKSVVLAPSERLAEYGYGQLQDADEWNAIEEQLEDLFGQGGARFELLRREKPVPWSGNGLGLGALM
jgi:hypothetical protein